MPHIPAMLAIVALLAQTAVYAPPALAAEPRYYPLPTGSGTHDVAPAPDGTVWYTGQRSGVLCHPGEAWTPESGTNRLAVGGTERCEPRLPAPYER